MAYVSRDPFARETLYRRAVFSATPTVRHACEWCGQTKVTRGGREYLYQYTVESDGGRMNTVRGSFCSAGCMRSYHS